LAKPAGECLKPIDVVQVYVFSNVGDLLNEGENGKTNDGMDSENRMASPWAFSHLAYLIFPEVFGHF
jgi:hypothetical protein